MKKNVKGFFLAETIVMIALVTAIMAFVYPNISKLYNNYVNKTKYYDQTEDVLTLRSIYERDRFDGGYIDSKTNNGCKEIDDKITIDTGIFLFDIDSDLKELYITSYMSSPIDNNYNFNRYLKRLKKTNFDSSAYRLIGVFDNGNEKRYASIKIENPNPTRDCNLGGDGSE